MLTTPFLSYCSRSSPLLYGPISFSSLSLLSPSPSLSLFSLFLPSFSDGVAAGIFRCLRKATAASATQSGCKPPLRRHGKEPGGEASPAFHHGRKLTIG